jgi:hypothetical protein
MPQRDEQSLRDGLVRIVLEWERRFGVAPRVTGDIAEYDAALLIGCTEADYSRAMSGRTAVSKGHDFEFRGVRYQVKSNRPSGKPGSFVTMVGKPKNYEWDMLIWVLYNERFEIQEAWRWPVDTFKEAFRDVKRLSPDDLRGGTQIWPPSIA